MILERFYKNLLIVVLSLNLVFWLTLICCRIVFNCSLEAGSGSACCVLVRRRRRRSPGGRTSRQQRRHGHRNSGFDTQETPTNQNPYSITSTMDLPPSYEEAAKYSLYSTENPMPYLQVVSMQRPDTVIIPTEQQVVLSVSDEPSNTSEAVSSSNVHQNLAQSSSHQNNARQLGQSLSNFEISPSSSSSHPLTPINEDDEDTTLTFVIDNIGVQSARLIGATNSTAKLIDGDALDTHSKC